MDITFSPPFPKLRVVVCHEVFEAFRPLTVPHRPLFLRLGRNIGHLVSPRNKRRRHDIWMAPRRSCILCVAPHRQRQHSSWNSRRLLAPCRDSAQATGVPAGPVLELERSRSQLPDDAEWHRPEGGHLVGPMGTPGSDPISDLDCWLLDSVLPVKVSLHGSLPLADSRLHHCWRAGWWSQAHWRAKPGQWKDEFPA